MSDFRVYGAKPLDELRQTITFAIWHAAERELGAQQMLPCQHDCCVGEIPPFDVEQWKRERAPEPTKQRHLVALRYAAEVGQDPTPWATNAREKGATWAEIGDVLGVSRQAAQQRFGARSEVPAECSGCSMPGGRHWDTCPNRGDGRPSR